MKHIAKLFLMTVIASVVMYSCGGDEGVEDVKVEGVAIACSPPITNSTLTVGDTRTVAVAVTPTNATDKSTTLISANPSVVRVTEETTGWAIEALAAGQATLTATAKDGGGATQSITITVLEPNVRLVAIDVTTQPDKKTYYVGEEFDPTGMVVTATYSDGSKLPVNNDDLDCKLNTHVAGVDKTCIVSYQDFDANVSGITVLELPITELTVIIPDGTYMYNGQPIKFDNLKVLAGKKELTVSNDFMWEPVYENNTNAGTAKVIVTGNGDYEGIIGEAEFVIVPCSIMVVARDIVKTYGSNDPELEYDVFLVHYVDNGGIDPDEVLTPGLYGSDALEGKLTRDVSEEVGKYAIVQGDLSGGNNYLLSIFVPADLDIVLFMGYGTEYIAYEIGNAKQLAKLAEFTNANNTAYNDKYYILTADIDLDDEEWTPIGASDNPFKGNFDGNGKIVSGLFINTPNVDYSGLFGYINGGAVQNLGVVGTVSSGNSSGGVAGELSSGSVTNCYTNVAVTGENYVGGVVGQSHTGIVTNCYAIGEVNGNEMVGGVVGYNVQGSVSNCYATGVVNGADNVGGVTGAGSASNCAALNPSITSGNLVGRVSSNGTVTYSVAWDGMRVNDATVTGGTFNNINGANISKTAAKTVTTYSGSGANQLYWPLGNIGDPWKMTTVGAYVLPALAWQDSSNYPTMPSHLAD